MSKKAQPNYVKVKSFQTEEQQQVIKLIWLIVIITLIVLGIYFFTRLFVTKDLNKGNETTPNFTSGTINYNTTLIGAMLSKPEDEYYVIMYDTEELDAIVYSGYVSAYKRNKKTIPVYMADLHNSLNKPYIDEEKANFSDDLKKFRVKDLALIKVKNGQIVESYSEEKQIADVLKYVKDTN